MDAEKADEINAEPDKGDVNGNLHHNMHRLPSSIDTKDVDCFNAKRSDNRVGSAMIFAIQVFVVVMLASINATYDPTFDAGSYGYFRDVSIMIFVGFGFLMTFLRRHGLSAIGFCFILSALAVEMSIVFEFLINSGQKVKDEHNGEYPVSIDNLKNGLFCAGAVMISLGAVIGKVTPVQLIVMTFFETIFFWVNARFVFHEIEAHDVGGGMTIHMFGAYFGLAVTWWMTKPCALDNEDESSVYTSDLFSLVGTLFLWCLWPSFQAAVAEGPQRQSLAVTNTFLSLCSSCMGFACVTRFLNDNKFDVVHMQNASLAGGVMMGVAGDMDMGLHGAMIAGFVSGVVSCYGYAKIQEVLLNTCSIHDTCGVNNLHGMPGILGAIIGIILAAKYGDEQGPLKTKGFPEMTAMKQVLGMLISFVLALCSGFLTGFIMDKGLPLLPLSFIGVLPESQYFHDRIFFGAESDYDLGGKSDQKGGDFPTVASNGESSTQCSV